MATLFILALVGSAQGQTSAQEGLAAVIQEDYDRAAILLRQAVTQDSSDVESWRLLGFSYRMLDSLKQATSAYDKVLAVAPQDRDARLALGNLYALQAEYQLSLQLYTSILEEDSTDLEADLGRIRTLAWKNDLTSAESGCRAILAANPDNIAALLQLAEVLSWEDRLEDAAATYHSILVMDSTQQEAWRGLGRVKQWADQPFSASQAYGQVLIRKPQDASIRANLEDLSRQTSWLLNPDYHYWAEDDGGLVTEYDETALRASRRLSDRFLVGGRFSTYNSFRHNLFRYRRTLGLQGTWFAGKGLTVEGEWNLDILAGRLETARISLKGKRGRGTPWLEGSAFLERVLYEPWSSTMATGMWGETTLHPVTRVAATLGLGYWRLSGGNFRHQGLAILSYSLPTRPSIQLLLRTRYLDFRRHITGYYSPQDLVQHEAGVVLDWKPVQPLTLTAVGFYALNTAEIRSSWLETAAAWSPTANLTANLGVAYFETDHSYRYASWHLGLVLKGWP